ncbi:hypothetical protein G7Z17_g211 [Cylindrodendrum hubeiense]|uniref:Uncharacterized protein n=1 Tax=Cylindrodendrum hubeiense TaxID=595255 RepID=A0A9P5HI03_9HYPO|nr:hypothetical protein G7Z17_g211 [Cylindrodendrum hubeiense]
MSPTTTPQRRRPGPKKKPLTHAFFNHVKFKQLPTINALCKDLGYEYSQEPRHEDFYTAVETYAMGFMSRPDQSHRRPLNWSIRESHKALMEMTKEFLEVHGNGQFYWPGIPGENIYDRKEYGKSSYQIHQTMAQLFFQTLEGPPIDRSTPMANVETGHASPPGSGQEQTFAPEELTHNHPLDPRALPSHGEGAAEDTMDVENFPPDTATGVVAEPALNEAGQDLPHVSNTPTSVRAPHRPSVEDVPDEYFNTRTNVLNNHRDRISSPDPIQEDSQDNQNNGKRPVGTSDGAQGPPTKRRKGKQPAKSGSGRNSHRTGPDGESAAKEDIVPAVAVEQPEPQGRFQRALSRPPRMSNSPNIHLMCSVSNRKGIMEPWTPKIGFNVMSLQRLAEDIPLDCHFTGLAFTLEIADEKILYSIALGDEDGFQIMLTRFSRKIRAFVRELEDPNHRDVLEMVIRPLRNMRRIDNGLIGF